jgi:hypothetical protein
MLRKYHSAITPTVREQMVGFVLMSMLCTPQHTYRYAFMRGHNNQSVIAAS